MQNEIIWHQSVFALECCFRCVYPWYVNWFCIPKRKCERAKTWRALRWKQTHFSGCSVHILPPMEHWRTFSLYTYTHADWFTYSDPRIYTVLNSDEDDDECKAKVNVSTWCENGKRANTQTHTQRAESALSADVLLHFVWFVPLPLNYLFFRLDIRLDFADVVYHATETEYVNIFNFGENRKCASTKQTKHRNTIVTVDFYITDICRN